MQRSIIKGERMLHAYRNHLLAANRSERTVNTYLSHLRKLNRHHPLMTVTADRLEQYIASLHTTHAPETRKSIRTACIGFYTWAHKKGHLQTNPALDLPPVHVPARIPRVAPDDLVQQALITADLHTTAMIMLARYGCLRLAELTTLHTRQREHDTLRIIGKGNKERLVPINEPLMHVLLVLERSQGDGYYFPGRFGGAMHPQSVNKIITRTLGMNPHSLRHAGATAAYRATNDLRAVQMLLGHASMATTQRYLHIGMDAVRRAADATVIPARFPTYGVPSRQAVA